MRNAALDEAQTEIKISGKNINNLRYTEDTSLTAESEEELKSLLMIVKEESEKPGLKWNLQKSKRIPEKIYCFIDYAKAFDCVGHNKLWKILQ